MKLAILLTASVGLAVSVANADETRIGVGAGAVGAGATVGESPEWDRPTVIEREREPGRTMVIKKEHGEPSSKVIIKERDRD
jgi:hypothetical protein